MEKEELHPQKTTQGVGGLHDTRPIDLVMERKVGWYLLCVTAPGSLFSKVRPNWNLPSEDGPTDQNGQQRVEDPFLLCPQVVYDPVHALKYPVEPPLPYGAFLITPQTIFLCPPPV
jgi:hypothetical protein